MMCADATVLRLVWLLVLNNMIPGASGLVVAPALRSTGPPSLRARRRHEGVALQEGNPDIPALTKHFNGKMKRQDVPLFATEEAFRRSLAVRRCSWSGVDTTKFTTEPSETIEFTAEPSAKYLPLCEQPFWANEDDVDQMVGQLKRSGSVERALVKYLAARSNSGKTSSVFAAFLKGLEEGKFTHLLYIAFDNNENRSFGVTGPQNREDSDLLELQGAAFILEVVKRLLMWPDSDNQKYMIERATREDLAGKSCDSLAKELQVFLRDKLGKNCKLLIQADEYPKMCGEHDGADSFHRGAMTLLSLTDEALDSSTVATHVRLLEAIPQLGSVSTANAGSAGVCRLPVACPRMDINKVMQDIPELRFPSGQWKKPQRRLLASLRFRLGLKITALGPQWLHLRGRNQDMERFLNAFNMSAQPAKDNPQNNRGVVRALVECSALCNVEFTAERAAPGAAELLVGREDIDFSGADDGSFQAGNFQVVVLDNGRVSASLESLLASFDPGCPVYNEGQSLFTDVLERNDEAVPDLAENADGDVSLLSGSPLEASFVWALSTRASIFGRLKFGKKVCVFQCTKLYPTPGGGGWTEGMHRPPSRLFPGRNSSDYNLSSVMDDANANAFFHVEEGAGLESHPLADAWFRAKIKGVDSLVLLDFAGGGFESASDKYENACRWIAAERLKVRTEYKLDLHVVILAPFAPGGRKLRPNANVEVVLGKDARLLLGGLGQVSRWFV